VIDRPDSVSRVIPPTTTINTTRAATMSSQRAMVRLVLRAPDAPLCAAIAAVPYMTPPGRLAIFAP
jgi:hypothetical protein